MSMYRRRLMIGMWDDWVSKTVSGDTPLLVENARSRDFQELRIYGRSIQEGEPSLDSPVECTDVWEYHADTDDYRICLSIENEHRTTDYEIISKKPLRGTSEYYEDFVVTTGTHRNTIDRIYLDKDLTFESVTFVGDMVHFTMSFTKNDFAKPAQNKRANGGCIMSNCFARIPETGSEALEGVRITKESNAEFHVNQSRIGGEGLTEEEYISNFTALLKEKNVWLQYGKAAATHTYETPVSIFQDGYSFTVWAKNSKGQTTRVGLKYCAYEEEK